jgi:hypothetical protein
MDKQELQVLEQKVSSLINEHLELITIDAKSLADAKVRAAKFLVVTSILATFIKNLEQDLSKANTVTEASYAYGISMIDGTKITEKKIEVANNKQYTDAREHQEYIEAFKNWVRTHIKIFDHAHLMFRQYSRD